MCGWDFVVGLGDFAGGFGEVVVVDGERDGVDGGMGEVGRLAGVGMYYGAAALV